MIAMSRKVFDMRLLPGQRFGNYKLRTSTEIGFDVSERSVVVTLLQSGISESGDNKKEALTNLKSFVSDILDRDRDNPNQPLGRELARQMRELNKIFIYVG